MPWSYGFGVPHELVNKRRGQRVLVTGATGFLGIRLVERLKAEGAELCLPVRDLGRLEQALARHGLASVDVRGQVLDLRDAEGLAGAVAGFQPDLVYHLAGLVNVAAAKAGPLANWQDNLQTTWHLLEACRRTGSARAIIVASTDKAYGPAEQLPYREDMPLLGLSPYDCAKACADRVAQSYAHTYNLPIAVTRCGNFFGGGDLDFNRLIPGTIRSVLEGKVPELRSDGQFTRDFIHISDAVAAYFCLSDAVAGGAVEAGEAFNFSNECRMNVLSVVEMIMGLMGMEGHSPVVGDGAKGEIRDQYLDCRKARYRLGWAPRLDMQAGLSEAVEWYRRWWARDQAA